MTQDENDLLASFAQAIQAGANQVSSNAFALMFGQHRDWRKGDSGDRADRGVDPHPAEDNVPDDLIFYRVAIYFGYEGEKHGGSVPQVFDEIGFVDASKCGPIDGANGGLVIGVFTTDDYVLGVIHNVNHGALQ